MATTAADKTIYYKFRSPVLGLHAPGDHKLQDSSVSSLSYRPLPYQKELTTHTDQNAVAKNLKHDCYSNMEKSVTQDAYTAPSEKKQLNYGLKNHLLKSPHEMAQEYRYVSNICLDLDRHHSIGTTSYKDLFAPYPSSTLTDRYKHHQDFQAHTSYGNRMLGPHPQSEYVGSFVRKDLPARKGEVKDGSPIGRAKLNVTHNTITGESF